MSEMTNAQAALIAASNIATVVIDSRSGHVTPFAGDVSGVTTQRAEQFRKWLDAADEKAARLAAEAESLKSLPLDKRVERLEEQVTR